jgi:signal transduction histidine kinase
MSAQSRPWLGTSGATGPGETPASPGDVRSTELPTRASFGFLIAGAVGILVYRLAPEHVDPWIYQAIGLFSLLAVVVGIRRNRPARTGAWWVLAAGVACFFFADVVWIRVDYVFPSLADVLYLMGYGCLIGGLWIMLGGGGRRLDRAGWLDAAIVAGGAAVLVWIFAIDPYMPELPGSGSAVIAIAYPIMGLVLIAILARTLFAPGERPTALRMLVVSIAAISVADLAFAVLTANGVFSTASFIGPGWLLGYILLGAAALHPSMVQIGYDECASGERLTRMRLVVLAGAVLLALLAYYFGVWLRSGPGDEQVVIAGSAVVFILVVIRMAGLLREVEAQADDLGRREEERRRLLDRSTRVAEEARTRIAADLHDGPIQHLAAVGYDLQRLEHRLAPERQDELKPLLDRLSRGVYDEIRQLRRMMVSLRPPTLSELGLEDALRDCATELSAQGGFIWSMEAQLSGRLDEETETVLYRIAQESLTNVVKHARANHAFVRVWATGTFVHLEVHDDGRGFDPLHVRADAGSEHFGLVAMRQRAESVGGTFEVHSSPGEGTRVLVAIPVGAGQTPVLEEAIP